MRVFRYIEAAFWGEGLFSRASTGIRSHKVKLWQLKCRFEVRRTLPNYGVTCGTHALVELELNSPVLEGEGLAHNCWGAPGRTGLMLGLGHGGEDLFISHIQWDLGLLAASWSLESCLP